MVVEAAVCGTVEVGVYLRLTRIIQVLSCRQCIVSSSRISISVYRLYEIIVFFSCYCGSNFAQSSDHIDLSLPAPSASFWLQLNMYILIPSIRHSYEFRYKYQRESYTSARMYREVTEMLHECGSME